MKTSVTAAKFATGLPDVPSKQLSPLVWRIMGLNPGQFTLTGTNTYLVGSGPRRILVDTGEGRPGYRPLLKQHLADIGISISCIIITHHHYDHIGGIHQALSLCDNPADIPVYKHIGGPTSWFSTITGSGNPSVASNGGSKSEEGQADSPASSVEGHDKRAFTPLNDGDLFKAGDGCTLRAVYTPGHTTDHVSLFLEEETALFTGDCVLGVGSAVFERLGLYLRSLQRLVDFKPTRLYPGHGPVVEDGTTKIRDYIAHRQSREKQVLAALGSKDVRRIGASSHQLAKIMYAKEGVPHSLMIAAARSVWLHCGKLAEEGAVVALRTPSAAAAHATGIDATLESQPTGTIVPVTELTSMDMDLHLLWRLRDRPML